MSFLPFAIAAWLFLVGLYGIVSSRNLIRAILSLTVVQSATYLVLLGVGYSKGGQAPIFKLLIDRDDAMSCEGRDPARLWKPASPSDFFS